MSHPCSPRARRALPAVLGLGLVLAAPTGARADTQSTLVPPPPPVDFGTVKYDPTNAANMGIDPYEYNYCQVCSPTLATPNVAGCNGIVGIQHECQHYCHITDATVATYTSNPPHSGRHRPNPERGITEHTSVVDRRNWVHSMEHGAVVFLYNCPNGCNADLDRLRAVQKAVTGPDSKLPVFITPDPKLPVTGTAAFAAASWTWTYTADSVDTTAFTCFARQHALNGRECVNQKCPYFVF